MAGSNKKAELDNVTALIKTRKEHYSRLAIKKSLVQDIWMSPPEVIPEGISPGLAYILNTDTLVIRQHMDLIEDAVSLEMPSAYTVMDVNGRHMFYAIETTTCGQIFWCGGQRHFKLHIFDTDHNEILTLNRPYGFVYCCCCRLMRLKVYLPGETTLIGSVKISWSPFYTNFVLKDSNNKKIYKIHGPCCCYNGVCDCCRPTFKITKHGSKQQLATVKKLRTGHFTEWLANTDTFVMTVPSDADAYTRALFMGALFLIDYIYYEL